MPLTVYTLLCTETGNESSKPTHQSFLLNRLTISPCLEFSARKTFRVINKCFNVKILRQTLHLQTFYYPFITKTEKKKEKQKSSFQNNVKVRRETMRPNTRFSILPGTIYIIATYRMRTPLCLILVVNRHALRSTAGRSTLLI